ncbi:MAG: hypothetical protein LBD10_01215 [Desulfobulbus sp.]|jgi:hypothetical protein|uniref:hypothetical protein n=1 Tax=Desulfobulbus sp. TaxID=895 RepID=UPI00283ABCD6|nr:hypothetical protein [Desulfobulbus sp.]MDR2548814.1 hypothetical protein [Desulfobulbus sp.]
MTGVPVAEQAIFPGHISVNARQKKPRQLRQESRTPASIGRIFDLAELQDQECPLHVSQGRNLALWLKNFLSLYRANNIIFAGKLCGRNP